PPALESESLDLSLNLTVLGFTALVSLLTCVLFALIPALRASRPDLVAELKGHTPQFDGIRRLTVQQALIASQVALSLVALVSAGLFIRSLQTVEHVDPRFDVPRLAMLRFELGSQGYNEAQGREFQRQAIERTAAVSGVESVAVADFAPLFG